MQDRYGVQWEKAQIKFFMVPGHMAGKKGRDDLLYALGISQSYEVRTQGKVLVGIFRGACVSDSFAPLKAFRSVFDTRYAANICA
jgi:hypothetical protein